MNLFPISIFKIPFRYLPLLFSVPIWISLFSCSSKTENGEEIRIAKSLPGILKNGQDSLLHFQKDSLYLGKELYSGRVFTLFPDGDTASLHGYFNGLLENTQKRWYENGQISEKRNYINGEKEGIQEGWWPNGKRRFLFFTHHDAYEGEFREWDSEGFLYKDFHYVKGQEEGSQKLWWGNHTLRSNCIIRNGKRYGLLGIKICKNPYDSINKK